MQHLDDAARRYAEDGSATAVAGFTAAKRAAIIRRAVEDAAHIDQRRLRILSPVGGALSEGAPITAAPNRACIDARAIAYFVPLCGIAPGAPIGGDPLQPASIATIP